MSNEFVVDFNPRITQRMTRSDLKKLLLTVSRPAFWYGQSYVVKSKHIGAGVYDVTGDFS